jgi:Holliday junction resolvasome RuvABC endonuclease subunit
MTEPIKPSVVGLDLSIQASGIAQADGTPMVFKPSISTKINFALETMDEICQQVFKSIPDDVELVMLEAIAFDGHDSSRMLAQLQGIVRMTLFQAKIPFYLVAPNTLKVYATGNGKAGKTEVVQAAEKRLGYLAHDDNEADALWLRAMGTDLLGVPVAQLPQTHRRALDKFYARKPVLR